MQPIFRKCAATWFLRSQYKSGRSWFVWISWRKCENWPKQQLTKQSQSKTLTFHKVNNVKQIEMTLSQISGNRKCVYRNDTVFSWPLGQGTVVALLLFRLRERKCALLSPTWSNKTCRFNRKNRRKPPSHVADVFMCLWLLDFPLLSFRSNAIISVNIDVGCAFVWKCLNALIFLQGLVLQLFNSNGAIVIKSFL